MDKEPLRNGRADSNAAIRRGGRVTTDAGRNFLADLRQAALASLQSNNYIIDMNNMNILRMFSFLSSPSLRK
jgi:hypothetical protein